jgi:hypothetical protein
LFFVLSFWEGGGWDTNTLLSCLSWCFGRVSAAVFIVLFGGAGGLFVCLLGGMGGWDGMGRSIDRHLGLCGSSAPDFG